MITNTDQNDDSNFNYLSFIENMNLDPNSIFNSNKNDTNTFRPDVKKRKIRIKFTPEEDQRLRELVQKYGDHSWNLISSLMMNRNQRQCRERWKHYLSCNSDDASKPWTKKEDEILLRKYKELGAKWTKIARELPGRSDLQVKIRYIKHLKNKKSRYKYEVDELESSEEFSPDDYDDDDDNNERYFKKNDIGRNKKENINSEQQYNHNEEQEQKESNEQCSNAENIPFETKFENQIGKDLVVGNDRTQLDFIAKFCQCPDDDFFCQSLESSFLDWVNE